MQYSARMSPERSDALRAPTTRRRSAPTTGSGSRSSTATRASCRSCPTGSTRSAGITARCRAPATADALVAMRLNALVVDLAVLGPGELGVPRARLRAAPRAGGDRLHRPVVGRPARARAAARRRCLDDEAVPRRGADLRDRGGDPPPPAQRDAGARRRPAVGEITIRPDLYQAYAGEVSLELTAREFEILHLLSGSDRVLRREEIYERVWGYAMAHGDRSVDVFVRKLRQKLRAASPQWSYIHTHFGVGYRFAPERDGAGRRARARPGRAAAEAGAELDPALRELSRAAAGAPGVAHVAGAESQLVHIRVTSR